MIISVILPWGPFIFIIYHFITLKALRLRLPLGANWIRLDWNALFRVDKIVGKKNQMNKMHNTSPS